MSNEKKLLCVQEPVVDSNRNITGDNWFNYQYPTVKKTVERQTCVDTIGKNKREIPKEFLPVLVRSEIPSIFGFHEYVAFISYQPKNNETVLVFSTMHSTDDIDESTGDKNKPEIVTFYNMTEVGVDLLAHGSLL